MVPEDEPGGGMPDHHRHTWVHQLEKMHAVPIEEANQSQQASQHHVSFLLQKKIVVELIVVIKFWLSWVWLIHKWQVPHFAEFSAE